MMVSRNKNPELTKHLAEVVTKHLTDKKMSCEQFGYKCGFVKSTVFKIKEGINSSQSIYILTGLCKGLNCSLEDLISDHVPDDMFPNKGK